jgi:hypothetical protein
LNDPLLTSIREAMSTFESSSLRQSDGRLTYPNKDAVKMQRMMQNVIVLKFCGERGNHRKG